MKVVLPMAGPGTRLRPFSYTQPKHLIKIAGRPFIEYVLETLLQAKISEIIPVVGHKKDQIMNCLGDGTKLGVHINYVVQNQPKGIADAVLYSEELVGDESFMVYLPDTVIKDGIDKYVKLFSKESHAYALILTSKLPQSKLHNTGTIQIDKNGRVIKLEEKSPSPVSDIALAGVYFFRSPAIFDIMRKLSPSKRGELEITDAIQRLIDEGYTVHHQVTPREFIDIGNYEGLLKANRHILSFVGNGNEGRLQQGARSKGKMRIGDGTAIHENTKFYGPLYVGTGCRIGPSTSLGPYVSLGDNVIMKGGNISNSIIMDNSQLNLKGTISQSIIGQNTKVIEKSENDRVSSRKLILGDYSSLTI